MLTNLTQEEANSYVSLALERYIDFVEIEITSEYDNNILKYKLLLKGSIREETLIIDSKFYLKLLKQGIKLKNKEDNYEFSKHR